MEHGFQYHHAQHDYAMLTKWLPTTPSTIPENLLYNVGVGAFILNSKNEMLLVKEGSGVTKGLVGLLQPMPTRINNMLSKDRLPSKQTRLKQILGPWVVDLGLRIFVHMMLQGDALSPVCCVQASIKRSDVSAGSSNNLCHQTHCL